MVAANRRWGKRASKFLHRAPRPFVSEEKLRPLKLSPFFRSKWSLHLKRERGAHTCDVMMVMMVKKMIVIMMMKYFFKSKKITDNFMSENSLGWDILCTFDFFWWRWYQGISRDVEGYRSQHMLVNPWDTEGYPIHYPGICVITYVVKPVGYWGI